jgi:hypothetical protein
MSKEQYIHADYNGYQYQKVRHHVGIPSHFSRPLKYVSGRLSMKLLGLPLDPLGLFLFSSVPARGVRRKSQEAAADSRRQASIGVILFKSSRDD